MASSVVSQALVTVPWNASRCPPAKLGVSAAVAGLSSLLSSGCRISTSRVSFCPVVAAPVRRRSFVVRAEEEAAESVGDAPAEEVPEVEGGVEEAESGAVDVAVAVEEKPPRKTRVKLGDVMGILNKRAVEAAVLERPTPDIRPGDVVQLRMKVPHNTRRLARYRGIVISRQNAGFHTTIRIRRIIAGIGVEMTFPLYSPNLKEITVFQRKKVRRAKLYYLKDKLPRFSTFKFK